MLAGQHRGPRPTGGEPAQRGPDGVGQARDDHRLAPDQPGHALGGHLGRRRHMNRGRYSVNSSVPTPAAAAKPVSTGPGHRAVTVTPAGRARPAGPRCS